MVAVEVASLWEVGGLLAGRGWIGSSSFDGALGKAATIEMRDAKHNTDVEIGDFIFCW